MRVATRARWLLETPIAHRGLHGPGAPELSRAALDRAFKAGVAIEIDVRNCLDRTVVVHDEDTERVTGVRLVVADSTFADLQALAVLDSTEPLQSLDEVLTTIGGSVPLLIEVKHGIRAASIGPAVMASLEHYDGAWAVQSFDPRIVRWFRRNAPDAIRGQISGDLSQEGLGLAKRLVLETMVWNVITRPDFLVWDVDGLPSRVVSFWCKVLKCPVVAWTARTEHHLARARAAHAGVIFEDVQPPGTAGDDLSDSRDGAAGPGLERHPGDAV